MEEISLEIQPREELGKSKVKDLRGEGFVPAVIYAQGKKSLPIKVSHKQLLQLIHQHRLESAVISLKPKDDKKAKGRSCLIKEIQYDPVKGDVMHVDFNEISLTKIIKVNVPVVAKGEPAGVKQEGGSLEHILWEIEVECLPTEIPKDIEVDVSQLKIGDSIHIKDITFPAQVKVLNAPEAIVFAVSAPIKEEEIVAPVAEGEEKQEPEVIKEKKEVAVEDEEEKPEKEKK
ncbi:MAG: 50S ribosomal protein L25 [Candidatus Omnitrophica bacterium]|nr:50S ribosomal protein L25 [Candidatus Omnitrophota bacterium]MDD5592963.1 50S ribosomal protein L25 [Candidatus Omnitrophota bacterium]